MPLETNAKNFMFTMFSEIFPLTASLVRIFGMQAVDKYTNTHTKHQKQHKSTLGKFVLRKRAIINFGKIETIAQNIHMNRFLLLPACLTACLPAFPPSDGNVIMVFYLENIKSNGRGMHHIGFRLYASTLYMSERCVPTVMITCSSLVVLLYCIREGEADSIRSYIMKVKN